MAFAQTPPSLGTASSYGAFSGQGAIGNTGLTVLTGDIGTNAGAFTGFPPGQYTGAKHVADPPALVAKNDVIAAYNQGQAISCDTTLSVTLGNGQLLTPRTYCLGPAATLTGSLILDAKGNPSAVFVIKVGGALNVAARAHIVLTNLAQAANVYWIVNGAVSILDSSVFNGTIIANGAIHLYTGSTLQGRMLAVVGAITMASNQITVPTSTPRASLVVVRPNSGDTVLANTKQYQIVWTGTSLTTQKTLEYSLDGGLSWSPIGTMNSDVMSYSWNVPDTTSQHSIVRVTDANGITGSSGEFIISSGSSVTPSLIVVRPGTGETIVGGTQNYPITWTGSGITTQKTFEFSLDGGATWQTIGNQSADILTYPWNVPDTASSRALVRITDKNGLSGTSGLFTILSSKSPSIVVTHPEAGESIAAGTQGYQITWTAVQITPAKTFELSLDNGITWQTIGTLNSDATSFSWNVPDTATTIAMIRITDGSGTTGRSGAFTITKPNPGVGEITSLTLTGLTNDNIGNAMNLGIDWTFNPDIGPDVTVEYLLDAQSQWTAIGTVPTAESTNISWMTPISGTYPAALIRVTSTKGMTRTSAPFSIGTIASVNTAQALGYSLSNYPNPATNETTISYELPLRGDATLIVNDATGRELLRLKSQNLEAGTHTFDFNTSNLTSGVYSYRLLVGNTILLGRMEIVK